MVDGRPPGGDSARSAGEGPHDPLQGTSYRTIRRLGCGGMGEVVLAEHTELGKRVVVKMLHVHLLDNPRLLERARIEAKALGNLKHPSIVQVTDFGHTPAGRPYLVMERLRGFTLAEELVRRGALGSSESVRLARELLSALALAHGQGIVHRDIKLSNLFIHHPPAGTPVLKVLDFGIAKILQGVSPTAPAPLSLPTEQGVVVGTPRFLSPEAIAGQAVDHRADLYAVGLVLYSLTSGRGPWDDETRDSHVLAAQLRREPKPPSSYARQAIVPELDRAIMKALEKKPAARFQSAAEFDQELARIQDKLDAPAHWHDTVFSDKIGAGVGHAVLANQGKHDSPLPNQASRAPSEPCDADVLAATAPGRTPSAVGRRAFELVCFFAGVMLAGAAAWWLLHWIAG